MSPQDVGSPASLLAKKGRDLYSIENLSLLGYKVSGKIKLKKIKKRAE